MTQLVDQPLPDMPEPDLTATEARALTDRIRESVTELLPLIREAFQRRADKALGYGSWSDYCDTELRGLRIPVQDRPEAVAQLRGAGMSTRAIGSALGTSEATVRRDLGIASNDAMPDRVSTLDGRDYPSSRPVPPEVSAAMRDAMAEAQREKADREALRELADELGLEHDPRADAQRDATTAVLYPFFDALAVIAAMPAPADVVSRVQPYQQYRLDELPGALAWLSEFAHAWKEAQ